MFNQLRFWKRKHNISAATAVEASNAVTSELSQSESVRSAPPHRVSLFTEPGGASATLENKLAHADYAIRSGSIADAFDLIASSPPDVALVELRLGEDGVSGGVKLARRLRAEPATYAVPLVFLFREENRALRNLALCAGADDYFSLHTPPEEMRARIEALFWRAEVGRRGASRVGDQCSEIDNFIFQLDSIREAAANDGTGTVALVEAITRAGSLNRAASNRTLAEAYGFFKLHLRRIDSVAFYGPVSLLIYLPGTDSEVARLLLKRRREEFLEKRPHSDIAIGMASFPTGGNDIEKLIERAEVATAAARAHGLHLRVIASEMDEDHAEKIAAPDITPESEWSSGARAGRGDVLAGILARSQPSTPQAGQETKLKVVGGTGVSVLSPEAGRERVEAPDDHALDAARKERESEASDPAACGRLLLAVSDPARLARLNSLVRSAGYEVRAAFDGQHALGLLRIERPDLLLIDYELRDINGIETLRRLRQQSGGKLKLPVVMLLDAEQAGAEDEALELGARAVVKSSFDPSELLECMRAIGNVN